MDKYNRITLSTPKKELVDTLEKELRPGQKLSPYICDILERWFGIGRYEGKRPGKEIVEEADKAEE